MGERGAGGRRRGKARRLRSTSTFFNQPPDIRPRTAALPPQAVVHTREGHPNCSHCLPAVKSAGGHSQRRWVHSREGASSEKASLPSAAKKCQEQISWRPGCLICEVWTREWSLGLGPPFPLKESQILTPIIRRFCASPSYFRRFYSQVITTATDFHG